MNAAKVTAAIFAVLLLAPLCMESGSGFAAPFK
jgi:hypothetical protein